MVGAREDEIEKLINDFKFNRSYRIHSVLGKLLHLSLPTMPKNSVVVPIATIAKHVRIRGYDHADLLAGSFASQRRLKKAHLLRRKTNTVQLGATAKVRRQQAECAYECRFSLSPDTPYLLVDDIATTGATLIAAARCLQQAGARVIMAAVVARQPLEPPRMRQ